MKRVVDRLEEVAYSDEATPDVNYEYDADGRAVREHVSFRSGPLQAWFSPGK